MLAARSPGVSPSDGAWSTDTFDPSEADLLLQAALVAATGVTGSACLPTSIQEIRAMSRAPVDRLWFIEVRLRDTSGDVVLSDVTAMTDQGTPVLQMSGVKTVGSPTLAPLFTH